MGEQRVADRPFFHVMNQITGSVVELDMRPGSNIMLRWWWWWGCSLCLSVILCLFIIIGHALARIHQRTSPKMEGHAMWRTAVLQVRNGQRYIYPWRLLKGQMVA